MYVEYFYLSVCTVGRLKGQNSSSHANSLRMKINAWITMIAYVLEWNGIIFFIFILTIGYI